MRVPRPDASVANALRRVASGRGVGGALGPRVEHMTVPEFTQSRFQHRDMSGINITPLVDVLLVLLIIFMIRSIRKSQSLDLTLSQPAPPRSIPPSPRTLISVEMDGRIRMEGASIALQEVRAERIAFKARISEASLALETNEGADYTLFAPALSDARSAGFAEVALSP